jgi:hypothetical protein
MKTLSLSRCAMGLPSGTAVLGFFFACGKLIFLVSFRACLQALV